MKGKQAIWVIASKAGGKRIQKIFSEARLINPIKQIITPDDLLSALQPGCTPPRLILLDVSLPDGISWEALNVLCERNLESRVIALVDGESETLLDRAYEAGIKTYLRKDFSFSDFLERTRAVKLQFVLAQS